MKELTINIEKTGIRTVVGTILGNNKEDACFSYSADYLKQKDAKPVSISLPLQEEPFSADRTRCYFEGLLPEGFTRRSVAQWMHVEEADYLSILAGLGKECLGALQVTEEGHFPESSSYEKLSDERVLALAREGTTVSAELVIKAHLSLTGASGKVGLYYDNMKSDWYLPKGDAPSTHILKQSHVRLLDIVANEQLCLTTARNLGIDVPDSFIVNPGGDSGEDVLFATRRFDRTFTGPERFADGMRIPNRLHQEDFAQALGIPSSGKYENSKSGYIARIFELLRNWSSDPLKDQLKLWDILVFDFLVGNTDNHLKNFSLLYTEGLEQIHLAPAYDIVSTSVYDGATRNMSFFFGNENSLDSVSEDSLRTACTEAGLSPDLGIRRFCFLRDHFVQAIETASRQLTADGYPNTEGLRKRILQTGGIARYL